MPTIRENLLTLKALIERTPEEGVDLQSFTKECGTLHCTLGWAAQSGLFEEYGLRLIPNGGVEINGMSCSSELLKGVFGENPWRLFEERSHSAFDTGSLTGKSDKELALRRIYKQLTNYPE